MGEVISFGDNKLNVLDLAKYVSQRYKEENNGKLISKIKLQKTIFMMFYEHGKFIKNQINNRDKNITYEIDYYVKGQLEDNYLLDDDAEFQAWVYGPVIKSVYDKYDIIANPSDDLVFLFENSTIQQILDRSIDMAFNTDDFMLVDVTHTFEAWRSNFNESDIYHNNIMPKKDIICGINGFRIEKN